MYWGYWNDDWYSSGWYNGPWQSVNPDSVPLFVLRVPVRYYRQPPPYFRGWGSDASPHWGEHWGRNWEQHRAGWDRWDRGSGPAAAPLPVYQRQYSKDRYPATEAQQRSIQSANYHDQPEAATSRQNPEQPRTSIPQRASPQARPSPPTEQRQERPPPYQPVQQAAQHPQDQAQAESRQTQHAPQNSARERPVAPEVKARQNQGEQQQRAQKKSGKSGEDRGGRDQ